MHPVDGTNKNIRKEMIMQNGQNISRGFSIGFAALMALTLICLAFAPAEPLFAG